LEILEIIVVNTNFTFTIAMGCDSVSKPLPTGFLEKWLFFFLGPTLCT
jgi:hypothetical protein